MRLRLLPLLLLAWPLIEIAGFVVVGRQVGVLATIGLVLATAFAGAVLLRFQGFGALARIQAEIRARRNPSRELAHGVMIMVAGVLLLLPGFLTDILGILLFIPPVRDLGWRFLRSRLSATTNLSRFAVLRRFGGEPPRTIDLDNDDYTGSRPPNKR